MSKWSMAMGSVKDKNPAGNEKTVLVSVFQGLDVWILRIVIDSKAS